MARGDMLVENKTGSVGLEILNRALRPGDGVPITLDFADVTETEGGIKVVRGGTPIDKDGKPVTATPWTGAIGILLCDVYETRPQGTILKRAYIHVTRAQKNTGLTYDSALAEALNKASCNIILEEPIITE